MKNNKVALSNQLYWLYIYIYREWTIQLYLEIEKKKKKKKKWSIIENFKQSNGRYKSTYSLRGLEGLEHIQMMNLGVSLDTFDDTHQLHMYIHTTSQRTLLHSLLQAPSLLQLQTILNIIYQVSILMYLYFFPSFPMYTFTIILNI